MHIWRTYAKRQRHRLCRSPMLLVRTKRPASRRSQLSCSLIPRSEGETGASTDSGKSILSYYDAECQLVFEEGKIEPIQVTNYISPSVNSPNGAEVNLPQIERFRPSRSRSQLRMQFTLESTKAMPYGLAVWGKSRRTHLGDLKRTGRNVVRRSVVVLFGSTYK